MLVNVCNGVYLVTTLTTTDTPLFRALKGVPGSVISRRSAAIVHAFELPRPSDGLVHVTANAGRGQHLPGVSVHETRWLPKADIQVVGAGLLVTSPARTIIDLAAELRAARLRHLIQRQVVAQKPSAPELHACFVATARRGRKGIALVRKLLIELFDAQPLPESELELRVFMGLRTEGIVDLNTQFRPPWFDGVRGIVDFAHHPAKVIIEADGRRWHATEQAMADDRRRDRLASSQGWVVLRVSWTEVVGRPAATFSELAAVIRARTSFAAA